MLTTRRHTAVFSSSGLASRGNRLDPIAIGCVILAHIGINVDKGFSKMYIHTLLIHYCPQDDRNNSAGGYFIPD